MRWAVQATTKINRKDFALGWNAVVETGGVLVGEEITIELANQFISSKRLHRSRQPLGFERLGLKTLKGL